MSSPKRLARIAGLLYLINGIVAGFAYGFVATKMYVAGDATATAGNVLANPGLVRLGVVADLFQATEWVFLAMALYLLLQHVDANAARAMVVLVVVGAAIACLNDVFEFVARAGRDRSVPMQPPSERRGRMRSCCSCSTSSITASSSPRSSLACGCCRWDISPTDQGCSPRRWASLLIVAGVCYLVDMLAAVPGPRLRQADQRVPGNPAHHRGDVDGAVPARERGQVSTPD